MAATERNTIGLRSANPGRLIRSADLLWQGQESKGKRHPHLAFGSAGTALTPPPPFPAAVRGPGEGLALPRFIFSPSPAAAGEGAGG